MDIIFEKDIDTKRIVISPRPIWKCRTCFMYNKRPSCPPYTPLWKEAKEWLSFYKKALLIKFDISMDRFDEEKRDVIYYLLDKERFFFNQSNPFAFSLFPGSCNLCYSCSFEKKGVCIHPKKVRPSVDALGIELTSITEISFKETVLYGLVLIS